MNEWCLLNDHEKRKAILNNDLSSMIMDHWNRIPSYDQWTLISEYRMPIGFGEKYWYDMVGKNEMVFLQKQDVPDFVTSIWGKLTSNQKLVCLRYQKIPQVVAWHWNGFTREEIERACEYQDIGLLVIEHWWVLSDYMKNICCMRQKISQFVIENWNLLTDTQKIHCCKDQNIGEFLIKHWKDLDFTCKNLAYTSQNIPEEVASEDWGASNKKELQKSRRPNRVRTLKERAIRYAAEHGLKIKDGYLYAYRNHDRFGRGNYNPNCFYERGKYYQDWHCDYNGNVHNSHGYGIWPIGNTVVRVKLEDFGVAVTNDSQGKARVLGFEIV